MRLQIASFYTICNTTCRLHIANKSHHLKLWLVMALARSGETTPEIVHMYIGIMTTALHNKRIHCAL
jgi:hypothetical protein